MVPSVAFSTANDTYPEKKRCCIGAFVSTKLYAEDNTFGRTM